MQVTLRSRIRAFETVFAVGLCAAVSSPDERASDERATATDDGQRDDRATIFVAVVASFERPWTIAAEDLAALRELDSKHPDVRWTHLYAPSARARSTPLRDSIEAHLRAARSRDGEEVGVVLRPVPELVLAAGVELRSESSGARSNEAESHGLDGAEASITAYTDDEIDALLDWSVRTTRDAGLASPRTFASGDHSASPTLHRALARAGFRVSVGASPGHPAAVGAPTDASSRHAEPRNARSRKPRLQSVTTPQRLSAESALPGRGPPYLRAVDGPVLELSLSGRRVDLPTTEELLAALRAGIETARSGSSSVVTFGLRVASAAKDSPELDRVLSLAGEFSRSLDAPAIRFVTASELRDEWLDRLPVPSSLDERLAELRGLGGTVFERSGRRVAEIVLNGTLVTDRDLRLVADFEHLTDLSLERTRVGNDGVAHLAPLRSLEWLNLFSTRVGDRGLEAISKIHSLRHLPMGNTRVTDAGIAHLSKLPRLDYLGLRGTRVTDRSLETIARLRSLAGLHLGETAVTDAGVAELRGKSSLRRLWLHDTKVTDASVDVLATLSDLEELFVYRSSMTVGGVIRLRAKLPSCSIYYRSASRAER